MPTVTEVTKDVQSYGRVEGLRIVGETTREFDVTFTDGEPLIQQTLQSLIASGIPYYWEAHPYDPWSYVSQKAERFLGASIRRVTVTYSTIEDPFARDPIISYTFSGTNEAIDRDKNGDPILNTVNESPDPPINEDYHDLVVRYNHNWQTYDPLIASDFQNSVNSDNFMIAGHSYPPRTVLIKDFSAEPMRAGPITYWNVTLEFHVRYNAEDEGKPDNEKKGEWVRRIVNEGFREKTGTDDDGKPTYAEILDDNLNKVSQPVQLDEDGVKIKEGDPIYMLAFYTKKERDFSNLIMA